MTGIIWQIERAHHESHIFRARPDTALLDVYNKSRLKTAIRTALFVVVLIGLSTSAMGITSRWAPRAPSYRLTKPVALYPEDRRRVMTSEDFTRFPGAGVLYCRDPEGVSRKAAAAWLIGDRRLVMMNAHNFRDRGGAATRSIGECFFQIGGRNYEFAQSGMTLGTGGADKPLHITDDWALAWLKDSVIGSVSPQPVPRLVSLPTGQTTLKVTMVSPAGHANFPGPSSIETCEVLAIDRPSEDRIRRIRHDCNDGYGGSGSGLFDEAGHLIAMQSASLDMNRRIAFDIDLHYGSALLLEGALRDAIVQKVGGKP